MKIGYACLAIAVPGSEMKSCLMKNASEERLLDLISHNLNSLETLIDYNIDQSIYLFRISSDLIPFGSSLALDLPWPRIYAERLSVIGEKIRHSGMRVSMHPGQYTVLNSPDGSVVERAVNDLTYHARVLDSLGLGREHKIILHTGGVYGDKDQAKNRFKTYYQKLDPIVKNRLVLENDDRNYTIEDVLDVATPLGMPVVFDNLHHAINPAEKSHADLEWIIQCSLTWQKADGAQKIHYSQQHPDKKPGAHSDYIRIDPFLDFYRHLHGMNVDVMLEVKDKNLSAIKCINCVSQRGIVALESEWAKYKYSVLEHSPDRYHAIRQLLRDKNRYPALEMYRLIEDSLDQPIAIGNGVNAAQHVWGYFKTQASQSEKHRFEILLQQYSSGKTEIQTVKNHLLRLAMKYQESYLLHSYYFHG